MSTSRSLISVNAVIVAGLVLGLLNNVLIAAMFGLHRGVDAFFAASLLPAMFVALCVDYLGRNFLPVYARAKKLGDAHASDVTSSIVTIVFVAALALGLALALASRPLFTLLLPGFEASEIELVSRYFWVMAPALALMAVRTFHEYVCQHDEMYVRLTVIRTALPAVNLAALLALGPVLGEWSLPLAFLAGHLAAFVLMARQARYRYRPRFSLRADWERRVFTNSAVLMGAGLAARVPPLIATYLASLLGPGAITALAFANKIIEPIGRSTLTGVRMLVFSRSARLYLDRNTREMSRLYGLALAASFLALVPLLAWLGFNATEIVRWVFERGRFDVGMAGLVATALLGFLPCAVLYGLNTVLSNAFYAADRIAVPALVPLFGTAVYVAVAWPLAQAFGLMGLTLAYSAAAVVTFVVMLVLLRRLLPEFRPGDIGAKLAAYTVLAVAAFGAAHALLRSVGLGPTAVAAVSLATGGIVYVGALAACRDPYLRRLFKFFGSAVDFRARAREGEA